MKLKNIGKINFKDNSATLGYLFLSFLFLSACTMGLAFEKDKSILENYLKVDKFSYAEAPIKDLGEPLVLWATNYHLPELIDGSGDIPLRDIDGNELGPKLTLAEWCKSALEGSVRILLKNGKARTYNYDASTELFPNDCTPFYPFNLGNTKFRVSSGSFGDGINRFRLSPYRTLATDPAIIPTGLFCLSLKHGGR